MSLAPVIFFVYNRPTHTQKTLEALSANLLASQSRLYIFADGPKITATSSDLEKIRQVREVIRQKNWCREVHIIESDTNIGCADSIMAGVNEIINRHGKVIVLEDDLLTSPLFLTYMNQALDRYQSDDNVWQISGFGYVNDERLPETYFLPISSSWGWATWQRAWQKINFDVKYLCKSIQNNRKTKEFDFGNYPYFRMLKKQMNGEIDAWDIRFYGSIFLSDGLVLFPRQTLIQNIGFDSSGTHTSGATPFRGVTINVESSKPAFWFPSPQRNREHEAILERYLKKMSGLSQRLNISNLLNYVYRKIKSNT